MRRVAPAVGYESIPVRVLVAQGELPPEVLDPGPGWPELFPSYQEMAAAQGSPVLKNTEFAEEASPRCDEKPPAPPSRPVS